MPILSKVVLKKFDKELIPLIKELNSLGIKTIASCIDHNLTINGSSQAYIAIDMSDIFITVNNKMLTINFYWNPTINKGGEYYGGES